MMEVEVDEDCSMTVARTPIMRPTMGFCTYSLFISTPGATGGGLYYLIGMSCIIPKIGRCML